MEFRHAEHLSIAIELDCQLIEPSSLCLSTRASQLTSQMATPHRIRATPNQSTVALATVPSRDIEDVARQLRAAHQALTEQAVAHGLGLASTGTHPISRRPTAEIERAAAIANTVERARYLLRRTITCGMRVAIGMRDAESCIHFHNAFLNLQPLFLALSASSPFWQAEDTGLATCRPAAYAIVPTSGHPYRLKSWASFQSLIAALKHSNSIASHEHLAWDIRPNPDAGTLELSVFDGVATIQEAISLAALAWACAVMIESKSHIESLRPLPRWAIVENKWRAMSDGVDATILVNADGRTQSMREAVNDLLDVCAAFSTTSQFGRHVPMIRRIVSDGNSAKRQRQVFRRSSTLAAVVRHNVREFNEMRPVWQQAAVV